MPVTTLGRPFSEAILSACEALSHPKFRVVPRHLLEVYNLESGLDPQKVGWNGAAGLWMVMPKTGPNGEKVLYARPAAHIQVQESVRFWLSFIKDGVRSREDLYLTNIAPARLANPARDAETIVYSANPEDKALTGRGFEKTFWVQAYHDNAAPFGLDPGKPTYNAKGVMVSVAVTRGDARLRVRDLALGLDRYARLNKAKIDAELAAIDAVLDSRGAPAPVLPPVQWGPGGPVDLRDPAISPSLEREREERARKERA